MYNVVRSRTFINTTALLLPLTIAL